MYFCEFCGAQLGEGQVCSCRSYGGGYESPVYNRPAGDPKGKMMIFISGIILTVFGSIGIITALVGIAGSFVYMEMGYPFYILSGIMSLINAGISLAFGIFGTMNAKRQEKGSVIAGMGMTLLGMQILGVIINLAVNIPLFDVLFDIPGAIIGFVIGVFIGLIFGCALPVLYIIGGNMNRNSR